MKLNVILAVSVVLNVVLAALYFKKPAAPAVPAPEQVTTIYVTNPPAAARTESVTNFVGVATPVVIDWRAVESADYRKYIENLRAIGCPEETIRDIITADVNKLFSSRAQAERGTNRFEYWKGGNILAGAFDQATVARQQALMSEKRALLKELLGEGVEIKPEILPAFNPFDTLLDFLPESRRAELIDLEQKYAARMMDAAKEAQGGNTAALRQMYQDKDAELERLLGKEGKLEYDMRISQTAIMMRMQMTSFEPSEQEFRDVFKLRKGFDDQYPMFDMAGASPEKMEERKQAEQALNAQIKSSLGDERYREYKYDQDWTQSPLRHVATEHNVPRETAVKVFDLRDVAQDAAMKVANDNGLTPEQRAAALQAIRAESEKAVTDVLGPAAAADYMKRDLWLQQLGGR